MSGPTAEQWRAAANALREQAAKFDALAEVKLPASIEQLIATYNAVAGEVAHYDEHYPMGDGLTEIGLACRDLVNRLRSVKPRPK